MTSEVEMDQEATRMKQLRSKATEHLIREEWREAFELYSNFISLCYRQQERQPPPANPDSGLQKSLCLALSNRAEALLKLRDNSEALKDCEQALQIESGHVKTLICKGKILLGLNRYSSALECFQKALLDQNSLSGGNSKAVLNGYMEECKKLEHQSKTGSFDVSDWVMCGFNGRVPELGEFIGPIEIKYSSESGGGRGMFATRNMECGSLVVVTKAVATERCISPKYGRDLEESAQFVMWKNFINKVVESAQKSPKTRELLGLLSTGENITESDLPIPDLNLFRPEADALDSSYAVAEKPLDMDRIMNVLDVNSLVEDSVSSKVLGKNCDYYGIGLWILPSFINHSCCPNSRRLHIGDHAVILVSRDVKAGEEITLPYLDVLSSLTKRREMAKTWGFECRCRRCRFEDEAIFLTSKAAEMKEIETSVMENGLDFGCAIYRLEENMKKWGVRGREKGYLRASFWNAYSEAYRSEKVVRRWGRRLPSLEVVVESVAAAVGNDERILKLFVEKQVSLLPQRGGGGCNAVGMVERAMKQGRGVYGKIVKKQALRNLLELPIS